MSSGNNFGAFDDEFPSSTPNSRLDFIEEPVGESSEEPPSISDGPIEIPTLDPSMPRW